MSGRPGKLIDIGSPGCRDAEITVYIKGFLSPGEEPGHFEQWLNTHQTLERRLGWGSQAKGYCWYSREYTRIPLPLLTLTRIAWDVYRHARNLRRVSPISHLGFLAGEQAIRMATQFLRQYLAARDSAGACAPQLAYALGLLAQRFEHVRVVAHSLGCLQLIQATSQMDPADRPHEVHLCAPACCEPEVEDKLSEIARQRTLLYHTDNDLVLKVAFRAVSTAPALGSRGPLGVYHGLLPVDVSDYFDFWVHGQYKDRFADFAQNPA